jgi:hypothetical protein
VKSAIENGQLTDLNGSPIFASSAPLTFRLLDLGRGQIQITAEISTVPVTFCELANGQVNVTPEGTASPSGCALVDLFVLDRKSLKTFI